MDKKKKSPFILIAGPCVIESKQLILDISEEIKKITDELGIRFIFKSSFDKANRSSGNSFRGPGITKGLEILSEVKSKHGLELLTDIHDENQVKEAAQLVDVIQIPAFLCRQTSLLESASLMAQKYNRTVNVKKGQFLAPWDMKNVVKKFSETGLLPSSNKLWLTERGTCFGYNALVVDFRGLPQMREFGCPVIFDATHSVQQPGGKGNVSGGQREFVAPLSRAAMAVGVDGIFLEVHPEPDKALSDGPNMVFLNDLKSILLDLLTIHESHNY